MTSSPEEDPQQALAALLAELNEKTNEEIRRTERAPEYGVAHVPVLSIIPVQDVSNSHYLGTVSITYVVDDAYLPTEEQEARKPPSSGPQPFPYEPDWPPDDDETIRFF